MSEHLNGILNRMREDLAQQGDARGSEHVLDFMTMVAAAHEAVGALRRGDANATEFHTAVLNKSLETAELPLVQIVGDRCSGD